MNTKPDSDLNDDVTFYMQGWEPAREDQSRGLRSSTDWANTAGVMRTWSAALNEANYALFGFDLRGHGQAGGPRGHIPRSMPSCRTSASSSQFQQPRTTPALPVFLIRSQPGRAACTGVRAPIRRRLAMA
ncbi:MAG: lysophospholipase [Candidatus Moduliflexus flocculans]|nr:lysophospholipase [Candidatus Moduliflexus flocculans]